MAELKQVLISSIRPIFGNFITLLLFCYLKLGFECKKMHRSVHYKPIYCFDSLIQFAVNERRLGDEYQNSKVIA